MNQQQQLIESLCREFEKPLLRHRILGRMKRLYPVKPALIKLEKYNG